MPRTARLMVEDLPFHITHRGNERKTVFHSDEHRLEYLHLLERFAVQFGMNVRAYCLMDNHVHLIAMGRQRSSIARALGNTHRSYSRRRNRERDVTGHLWANRFFSTALDEPHLWAAVRYVELNPVRAGIVVHAAEYPWSSAAVHAGQAESSLLDPNRPFPGPIRDWSAWLALGLEEETANRIRRHTARGIPTGDLRFRSEIERRLGHGHRRNERRTR